MPKCDFNNGITLRHGCFPVNLLDIFITPFPKNTYGGLLLMTATSHDNNAALPINPFHASSFFLYPLKI